MSDPLKTHGESEVFDNFIPRSYIATYYPQVKDLKKLVTVAEQVHVAYNKDECIDIDFLASSSDLNHETVENIAIFHFQSTVAKVFLESFPKGDANILDIGGGPTIYQHIALSLSAQHITHSEYLEANREETLHWLRNKENPHDWDDYFALIKEMLRVNSGFQSVLKSQLQSGDSQVVQQAEKIKKIIEDADVESYKQLVRTCIDADVIHGDIFHSELAFKESKVDFFDVVTANFVVESATAEKEKWLLGMQNIVAHIKPGGYLVQTAIRNSAWYQVGNRKIPAVQIIEKDVEDFCAHNNLKIITMLCLEGSDFDKVGYDGMIFILAQKQI